MIQAAKKIAKRVLGVELSPRDAFLYYDYLRHDQRRLEQLASLGFIGTRQELKNPLLVTHVPMKQRRH